VTFRIMYRARAENLDKGEIIIEKIDKKLISEQVSIALREYERTGFVHKGPAENFRGFIAELVFNQFLKELGLKENIDYQWNKRRLDYFETTDEKSKWDFKLLRSGLKFEIGAAKPSHRYAVMKAAGYKKESDCFVQVQIKSLNCVAKVFYEGKDRWYKFDEKSESEGFVEITSDEQIKTFEQAEQSVIAKTVICGYDMVKTITKEEDGWEFSRAGAVITPNDDGYVKPLSELNSPRELGELVRRLGRQKTLS